MIILTYLLTHLSALHVDHLLFQENLDVGSGLDVTGNITCSGILDIEGDIHMASGETIQWVNTGTYISGTDTALTIDADDTLSLNA